MPASVRRLVAALTAATALTACAGATPADAGPTSAAVQLGWLPNVENMTTIVSVRKGYFADRGVEVEVLPGGPEVNAAAQVAGGNALMGVLSAEALANAVAAGADLVGLAATYQTTSSAIVTLAGSGIEEPADLAGRRLGVSQTDAPVYGPFFELVGVDAEAVEQVNTGSDPAALASGEVDAITGTLPNQPVALRSQGLEVSTIALADYGYHRWSGLLVVRRDSLADDAERATIVAMLAALREGAEDATSVPDGAARVVYDAYGPQLGLELPTQVEGARVWAELARANTDDTGLLRVDEAALGELQTFFDTVGITPAARDIFDLSVGEEAFDGGE